LIALQKKQPCIFIRGNHDELLLDWLLGNNEKFDEKLWKFFTSIEGKFNIYKYDCGNEIVETIEGKYGIFHGESFVILVKWC
jgi:UDP-2,3-diacylglucosamine pyrophosphatase LpxH